MSSQDVEQEKVFAAKGTAGWRHIGRGQFLLHLCDTFKPRGALPVLGFI